MIVISSSQAPQRPPPQPHPNTVGAKNGFFVQGSTVVKIGRNWLAVFRHRHFVIAVGGGGGLPPPPPISKPGALIENPDV